jgi:hypothetical protein
MRKLEQVCKRILGWQKKKKLKKKGLKRRDTIFCFDSINERNSMLDLRIIIIDQSREKVKCLVFIMTVVNFRFNIKHFRIILYTTLFFIKHINELLLSLRTVFLNRWDLSHC